MKRMIAVLCISAVFCGGILMATEMYEQSVPVAATISAEVKEYSEYALGSGRVSYIGQSELTSALPLVIESYCVNVGDEVEIGDVIAIVDREGTASLIEGLGQLSRLEVAAANLSTAVSLIPEAVTAHRNGRVVTTAGNGATVQSGDSIATLTDSETLVVTAAVNELYLSDIFVGQKAYFSCAAYPDKVFSGEVTDIADAARNQYSGSVLETVVDVTITPDKPDALLKSGLSVDAQFMISEGRQICVLPYGAIGQDDSGEYVYVYDNGTASRRRIATGAEFSDGTEIICGIDENDKVIMSPESIRESSFIRLEE